MLFRSSAVCSVSADPPQLLACINRQAETHALIEGASAFAVNVLAHHQHRLAKVFAGASGVYGDHRFAEAEWRTLVTGAPVLSTCVASFDCRLIELVPAATHSIFIGRVVAVELQAELDPLVYVEGDYGLIAPLMSSAR